MFTAYVVVTVLAAAANAFSATLDFIRYKQVLINMARAGVPESWITKLGILKARARSDCWYRRAIDRDGRRSRSHRVLCCSHHRHLRAREYSFGLAVVFLLLATAALALGMYARGSVALTLGAWIE